MPIKNKKRCLHGLLENQCGFCSGAVTKDNHRRILKATYYQPASQAPEGVLEKIKIVKESKMNHAIPIKTKVCQKCGDKKSLEKDFDKNKLCKDGYVNICKACKNKRLKDARAAKKVKSADTVRGPVPDPTEPIKRRNVLKVLEKERLYFLDKINRLDDAIEALTR